jgi:hypothetical protein
VGERRNRSLQLHFDVDVPHERARRLGEAEGDVVSRHFGLDTSGCEMEDDTHLTLG